MHLPQTCAKCGHAQDAGEYVLNRRTATGVAHLCRACHVPFQWWTPDQEQLLRHGCKVRGVVEVVVGCVLVEHMWRMALERYMDKFLQVFASTHPRPQVCKACNTKRPVDAFRQLAGRRSRDGTCNMCRNDRQQELRMLRAAGLAEQAPVRGVGWMHLCVV